MRSLSLAVVCALLMAPAAPQGIRWLKTLEEGKREAFAGRRFLILYFEDSASNQSFKMDHDTWNNPAVTALARNFVCVRIDNTDLSLGHNMILRDRAQKLLLRYRIQYTPTTVVTDAAGGEILRLTGYVRENDLREALSRIPADAGELSAVLERLDADPDNTRLKIEAADAYRLLRMPLQSNRYYDQVRAADTMRADPGLAERLALAHALNRYDLKQLKEAVGELEKILDDYPGSVQRAFKLFMLVRAYRELLNDVAARDYLNRLEKEFPESEYTRRARSLLQ